MATERDAFVNNSETRTDLLPAEPSPAPPSPPESSPLEEECHETACQAPPEHGANTSNSAQSGPSRAILSVRSARFVVPSRKCGRVVKEREILKGVSFDVRSGQTLAIMGPSGAGKTTLLDLLTLEGSSGTRTGRVVLNGKQLSSSLFMKLCSYVPQYDKGWTFLTCCETLQFSAGFRRTDARCLQVDTLLAEVGLQGCKNTLVGNEFVKGLSGGQRRRLSLAVALLKDPLVIFLDEVTSGLDSAAAASIMSFLRELACEKDVIIVTTIHQPPSKVFNGFDLLLLLSNGHTAYCGPAKNAVDHLASIGRCIPDCVSHAEFLLDVVNSDFADPASVQEVIAAWREHGSNVTAQLYFESQGDFRGNGQSIIMQTLLLCKRHLLLIWRDPSLYIGRAIINLCSCTFFAMVYISSRERVQGQALNRTWLMMWHVGVPTNMGVAAVFALNLEFAVVRREVKAGMYRVSAYIIAQMLLQIPLMLLLSLFSLSASGYAIGNWNASQFMNVIIVHAKILFAFECMAQAYGAMFPNPLLGMLAFMATWFAAFLFSGLLIAPSDVVSPLRWMCRIFPYRYGVSALIYLEFHAVTFDGANTDDTSVRGFSCPGDLSYKKCFGRTGVQVLDSLHSVFETVDSDDSTLSDAAACLLIACVWKIIFVAIAFSRCRGGPPVREAKCSDRVIPADVPSLLTADKDFSEKRVLKHGETLHGQGSPV